MKHILFFFFLLLIKSFFFLKVSAANRSGINSLEFQGARALSVLFLKMEPAEEQFLVEEKLGALILKELPSSNESTVAETSFDVQEGMRLFINHVNFVLTWKTFFFSARTVDVCS